MNEMKQRAEAKKKAKAAGKQLTDAELNGVAGGEAGDDQYKDPFATRPDELKERYKEGEG